ncbi:MAG: hypothetical protein KGL12_13365 [Rhodospirillales bacterium]|nr:hypothetical protein [Rhodospirillales bacterium]
MNEEAAALRALADWHRFKAPPGAAHAAMAASLDALAAALEAPDRQPALAAARAELGGLLHWLGEQDALAEYESLADRYRRSLDPAAMPDAAAYLAGLIRRARAAAGA